MRFPRLFRSRKSGHASSVAKTRLLLMNESEPIECAPDVMMHMKQEISDVIGRYLSVTAEEYEIKVILKKKRATSVNVQSAYDFDTAIAFTNT